MRFRTNPARRPGSAALALAACLLLFGCNKTGSVNPAPRAEKPVLKAASAHFERLNEVRVQMGLGVAKWHPTLATSARAHADYLTLNNSTGHDETPGAPGFTGESPVARAQAVGYGGAVVQESITGAAQATAAEGRQRMDSLLLAPLTRLRLLAAELDEVGIGISPVGGALVTNLGVSGYRLPDSVWVYPYTGQAGVAPVFLPGADATVSADLPALTGTPLTVSRYLFSKLTYVTASLKEEASGIEVRLLPQSRPGETTAALVFYPSQPLKPGTQYLWRVTGSADGLPTTLASRFTTAP